MSKSEVALVPAGLVTVTWTIPEPAGGVAVIWVAESTINVVAGLAPNVTAVAPLKLVPVIVTVIPPSAGLTTLDTVGIV